MLLYLKMPDFQRPNTQMSSFMCRGPNVHAWLCSGAPEAEVTLAGTDGEVVEGDKVV